MCIYYYIMVNPDVSGKCKIGITKNPEQRIKSYRTANPDCYFSKIYKLPDKRHEKLILDMLKTVFTVKSEYVFTSPEIIQNIIDCYFDDNEWDY